MQGDVPADLVHGGCAGVPAPAVHAGGLGTQRVLVEHWPPHTVRQCAELPSCIEQTSHISLACAVIASLNSSPGYAAASFCTCNGN